MSLEVDKKRISKLRDGRLVNIYFSRPFLKNGGMSRQFVDAIFQLMPCDATLKSLVSADHRDSVVMVVHSSEFPMLDEGSRIPEIFIQCTHDRVSKTIRLTADVDWLCWKHLNGIDKAGWRSIFLGKKVVIPEEELEVWGK